MSKNAERVGRERKKILPFEITNKGFFSDFSFCNCGPNPHQLDWECSELGPHRTPPTTARPGLRVEQETDVSILAPRPRRPLPVGCVEVFEAAGEAGHSLDYTLVVCEKSKLPEKAGKERACNAERLSDKSNFVLFIHLHF